MRVLSFIPAFLLAVTSFVAAVPTASPGATDAAPTTCGGTGNDAALQPIISIIANATTHIQPLCDQLSSANTGTPDVDTVCGIVTQIDVVVSFCVEQLQAAATVDLSGLDLTNLCSTISALLALVFTLLNTLVAIVLVLAGGAVGTLQTVVCNLLNSIINLVGCLQVFVVASVTGVLGPILSLVCGHVDCLLTVFGGLAVLVGASA
jgi:hypothetical protein